MARLFGQFDKRDVTLSVVTPDLWRNNALSGATPTGINVTPAIALTSAAYFAAIRFRAFAVAGLPKILYQRTKGGKRRAYEHPLYKVLHDIPNPEMTSFDLWALLDSQKMMRGNGFAEIEFDQRSGEVKYLWPLRPENMELMRNDANEIRYVYTLPEQFGGEKRVLRPEQVLHLRGLSVDGRWGLAPVTLMRNAVALAKATEEFGAAYFGNGAEPGLVLQHPGKLKDSEVYNRLKESWAESHQGLTNSHRMAILEEGMTVDKIGMSPEDSQFLETRTFQVYEIARMTDVPPQFIFELTNANFASLEQMSLDFVVHHLRPYLVSDEQQIFRSLLLQREQDNGYFMEFLVDALLRGDLVSRYNAYSIGKQNGWLSTNDILAMENKNTIGPKGDVYMVPLNFAVLGEDGMPVAVPTVPAVKEPNTPARSLESPSTASGRTPLSAQDVYKPILKDAAERIGKREVNEYTNARKKYGNSVVKLTAWAEQFYKRDYPQFIQQVINPLVEAGIVGDSVLRSFDGYCVSRGALALTDEMGVYVTDEIVSLFDEVSDERNN